MADEGQDSAPVERRSVLIAMSVLAGAGALLFNAAPAFWSQVAQAATLDEQSLGQLAGIAGLGTTLTTAFAVLWIPASNWKAASTIAFALVGVAIGLLATSGSFNLLAAALFLFNVGTAIIFVISLTVLSRSRDTSRAFGTKLVFEMGLAAGFAFLVSSLAGMHFGFTGLLGSLVCFYALAAIAIRYVPTNFMRSERSARKTTVDLSLKAITQAFKPERPISIVSSLSLFLTFCAISAVWIFLSQIGMANGLSQSETDSSFGVSILSGIAGAWLAAWLGSRVGFLAPLTFGTLAIFASFFLLSQPGSKTLFLVGGGVLSAAIQFQVAYLMALIASTDPYGRFSSMIPFLLSAAGTCGATVAGYILAHHNHTVLVGAASVAIIVSTVLAIVAVFGARKDASLELVGTT